ncbi:hypothetical protein DRP04_12360 [Archaeoglobales archaeon]|nr:MAG: hypothetical protein DRP04_12360 [Archaeoglobales archaeon]
MGSEYTIVSIYLNDIAFGGEQTILLDSYGKTYLLTIKSIDDWGWKKFYVNLTYPDGSTVSRKLERLQPFALDYDVKIQYYFSELDTMLDIDINIGGLADFPVQLESLPVNYTLSTFVLFNRVQGTSTKEMNVEIYYANKDWWNEIVESGSLFPSLGSLTGSLWDKFMGLVRQIPVAGEYLTDGLDFMKILIGETFFYIKLIFIDNWEITVLTFEAFAMMYSIQSRSIFTIFRRYWNFHENAFKLMFQIIRDILNLIWRLISAVGSLIPFT